MRLAKGFGKKGSKTCCFGKRFEAHGSSCFSWLQKNMGRSHSGLKGWKWKSIRSWFFRVSFWKNKMRSCHRIPLTQILEIWRNERLYPSIFFICFFCWNNRTLLIAMAMIPVYQGKASFSSYHRHLRIISSGQDWTKFTYRNRHHGNKMREQKETQFFNCCFLFWGFFFWN